MGEPTGLVYVVWEVTLRCDLSCGHCGSRAGKARSDELSTAEALDVVRQIADMGTREVTLIGGEAYLRPDWGQIARAIVDAGMDCTMTTGGRGLSAERAKIAADAGIGSMSVSVDGLEQTHDTLRGVKGSFASAMAAMDNLRAAGIPVAANTQINTLSFPELDPLLDRLIQQGIHGWQLQLTVPMGRAGDNHHWLLQPHDMLDVIPKVAELGERCQANGIRIWPGNNIGYFGPHESALRRGQSRAGHTTGCSAGKYSMGLEADGAIKGCPSLPTADYTGGHTRERSLREVWEETKELRFTRDRTVELWGTCKTCYYADVCRAGCTWTSHVFFGKPGNNPYCHHRALEAERQGLRERIVRVEAAPGVPFDHGQFELRREYLDGTLHSIEGGLHGQTDSVSPLRAAHVRERRNLPVL